MAPTYSLIGGRVGWRFLMVNNFATLAALAEVWAPLRVILVSTVFCFQSGGAAPNAGAEQTRTTNRRNIHM